MRTAFTNFLEKFMIYKKNNSNINIAYWFYNKATKHHVDISETKIQLLLFLSQMHYSIKYEKLLMPSLFVYSNYDIYDPSIRTIMNYGFPLMPAPEFDAETTNFLELIWQKYATLSEEKIQSFVYSLKFFKNMSNNTDDIIINPLNFTDSFISSVKNSTISSPKSKIMISQNGPVKVSAWTPRKLKK